MITRLLYAAVLVAIALVWLEDQRTRGAALARSYGHRGRHHGRGRVAVPRPRLHTDGSGRACLVDTVAAWWAVDS